MDKIASTLIKNWIINLGPREPLPWKTILSKATSKAVALAEQVSSIFQFLCNPQILQLMQMAPWDRMSAEEALAHPYLELYHSPENEPVLSDAILQVDVDAIEKLPMEELHAQLEQEANFFQQQRDVYDIERY
jgi:hypothetical protein